MIALIATLIIIGLIIGVAGILRQLDLLHRDVPIEAGFWGNKTFDANRLIEIEKPAYDYTTMSDSDYAFLTASGWDADAKTKKHFEDRLRKVSSLAEEQRRGIAQQRAILDAQKQLDQMPVEGIPVQHPTFITTFDDKNETMTITAEGLSRAVWTQRFFIT